MTQSVFIDGAVGTTGLEIRDRLRDRDEFELIVLPDDRRKDERARREALSDADFAILCLPDEAAREAIALIEDASGTRVIDASSAHRVADGWAYGFPELVGRDVIAEARFVSNPGCYPTGFLALIAPLIRAGMLPADWPYPVNAVSGYSGGGKALIERFEADRGIGFRAYGLGMGHKHLPEMQRHANLAHPPVFAPSVIPAHRGMLVEVPLPLEAMGVAARAAEMRSTLTSFYDESPIVELVESMPDEILLRVDEAPRDDLRLHVFESADGSQVRLLALLDNLGKGASGAAVQNLNLMAGIEETTGLHLPEN